MPANAGFATSARPPSDGAKADAGPVDGRGAPASLKRPVTSDDIIPVKSVTERSASEKAVGSRTATWLPLMANGAPPVALMVTPPQRHNVSSEEMSLTGAGR